MSTYFFKQKLKKVKYKNYIIVKNIIQKIKFKNRILILKKSQI